MPTASARTRGRAARDARSSARADRRRPTTHISHSATKTASFYWNRDHRLPMNTLMGFVVDGSGSVWIATARAGLARFRPSDGTWTYYTTASGLQSDQLNAISVDAFDGRRTLYVATANGLASFDAR